MLQGVRELLEYLVATFGETGTVLLVLGVVLLLAVRRIYLDRRADRLLQSALDEKERALQRVANQERQWRIYFIMREADFSRDEAEELIRENVFATPREAREALEQPLESDTGKNRSISTGGNSNDR